MTWLAICWLCHIMSSAQKVRTLSAAEIYIPRHSSANMTIISRLNGNNS
jgi:hypothetical protein